MTERRFEVAIIDPPWPYTKASMNPKRHGYVTRTDSNADKYKTMSLDDINSLDVDLLVERVVYLWTTGPFIQAGLDAIKHWGFEYKTMMYWGKTTKAGNLQTGGIGFWALGNCEPILVASRPGTKSVRTKTPALSLSTRPQTHSEKPEFLHLMVERCFKGPYLELFGRKPRKGWTVVGDAISGKDIRFDLAKLRRG